MSCQSVRRLLHTSVLAVVVTLAAPFVHAADWTTPTPEELSMTSDPQAPGAAAVVLYREETADDDLHSFSIYGRIKVLTDGGRRYGDVELEYGRRGELNITVDDIEGRTIHSDGTIIPFKGKPYEKLIEKSHGSKVMAKVISMPDVQVGSIIEFRYEIHYNDTGVIPPEWVIQSELFTRKAHFVWKPTSQDLVSDRGEINSIEWLPILPAGVKVQQTTRPATTLTPPQKIFTLDIENVPPAPDEDYMPPIKSLSYRVLFFYTTDRSPDDFWKNEGKRWSKERDKFIGPGHDVTTAVQQLTAPGDSQDQKLRKLYAAVMQLENTDFTRVRSTSEEKAEGLKEVHDTDDIWNRKRGDDDQLTELFVAMARAAGMKAYIFAVTNRDSNIFLKDYLSFSQLDDYIAVVNVDGKEQFFDPGSRYCPYGHLSWKHSMASGIRQTDHLTEFATSPIEAYTSSTTQRIADLTMDEHGVTTGIVKMTYIGAPALHWRQRSLTGDATSLNDEFRTTVEGLLPQGMNVKVVSIEHLTDYEQPLTVNFSVNGPIGLATGKRLFYLGDLFEANSKAAFPDAKRDIAVYFNYPSSMQDAVRVKFPTSFNVESSPANAKLDFEKMAAYVVQTSTTPSSIVVRRDFILGSIIFFPKEYDGLRAFYSKMEAADQGSVVLTTAAAKTTTAAN